jgi:uncharacterized damage-inducible protein DinB
MELDQEAQTTKRVLERVPEGKFSWKPHPKSYSLGQLAMHIAAAPGIVAGSAGKDTYEISGGPPPEPKNHKELMDTFSASLASAKDSLKDLNDARLMSTWNGMANGKVVLSIPRIGLIRAILLNHWYHHRGQLSVYLRLLDVPVPSIYGPSADENPFA